MNIIFTRNNLINDIIYINIKPYEDHRGTLYESYNQEIFAENGIPPVVQEKCSYSKYKVLRGLHYQESPYGQGKIIKCNSGKIFDVAVDIRQNSPTYKKWVSYELSAEEKNMVYIPPGFAHGILVLSENGSEFSYFTTLKHHPRHEKVIRYNHPEFNINWPIKDVILSENYFNALLYNLYHKMFQFIDYPNRGTNHVGAKYSKGFNKCAKFVRVNRK